MLGKKNIKNDKRKNAKRIEKKGLFSQDTQNTQRSTNKIHENIQYTKHRHSQRATPLPHPSGRLLTNNRVRYTTPFHTPFPERQVSNRSDGATILSAGTLLGATDTNNLQKEPLSPLEINKHALSTVNYRAIRPSRTVICSRLPHTPVDSYYYST